MQTFFILSLSATALGGAVSLGALFHLATTSPNRARSCGERIAGAEDASGSTVSSADELDDPCVEAAYGDDVRIEVERTEYDAKRREWETLTRRANAAVRALDAAASRLDARVVRTARSCARANLGTPFAFRAFDEREAAPTVRDPRRVVR